MAKQTDETKTPHVPKDLYALVQKVMGVKPDGSPHPFPRHAVYADGSEAPDIVSEYLPMRRQKSTGKEAMQFDAAVSAQIAKDKSMSADEKKRLQDGIAAAENVNSGDWEDVKQ